MSTRSNQGNASATRGQMRAVAPATVGRVSRIEIARYRRHRYAVAWALLSATALGRAVYAGDTATLAAPNSAPAGSSITVTWTGPGDGYDFLAVFPLQAPPGASPPAERSYATSSPIRVDVPEEPGEYELRYTSKQGATLARRRIVVTAVTASLKAEPTAVGGTSTEVAWSGPDNHNDHIVVVASGEPDRASSAGFLKWTTSGSPLRIPAPEKAGEYEIRYLTGAGGKVLARAKITVVPASASIAGPLTARAGETFTVTWTGPRNSYDHVGIYPKGAGAVRAVSDVFATAGSPMKMEAPLEAGEYELRYLTDQTQSVLARADLHVTPAAHRPGLVRVSRAARAAAEPGGAVEVILDTSGSMLSRIRGKRRIEIAKRTLTTLTSKVIPPGTPFALRVFGRGSSSCATELDIPLHALAAAPAGQQIAALAAKNGAKTPIAASLAKVADDLGGVKGERVVILITDGEETCGGNPAKEIETLRKNGVDVRINIVGFAVDDAHIAEAFRLWSKAGGGAYFDARDAAGLDKAVGLALAPGFEIVDGDEHVVVSGVVGGESVAVMPGSYSVRLKGQSGRGQPLTVREKETTTVQL